VYIDPMKTAGDMPVILGNTQSLYDGNLWHYFKVLARAKSANNSYHNVQHPLHATWLAYSAIRFYLKIQKELNRRQARNLLIGTLLHDVFHYGHNVVADRHNIETALATIKANLLPEDEPYFDDIAEIVEASEYPHRKDLEPLSLEQSSANCGLGLCLST